MRALNKGWIGIALVILFGASLFFFRGSSRYSNLFNSDNFVANVSGTQISTTQFMRALEMNIGQFSQMIGQDLTGEQIRAFQIHQLVLQNLINNAIFENEFDKLKFILDDSTVASQTKKRFPNIYINNKINDEALNTFLRQQRLKIEDLVNIISYETRANVFDDLFFEKKYPTEFSKKINLYDNQTREISLIKIPYQDIKIPNLDEENIKIDDEELIEYYEENSNKYMSIEKRDISYLVIDKNNYKDNFIPSESEITEYFNTNKEMFNTPEGRTFKQFNFKSKEEAENFKKQTIGLSNSEIINYVNEKNIKFNEFKEVNRNQVLEELSNAIFSLNIGEVSNVITTDLAYHIVILDDILLQKDAVLNDAKNIIKETLTNVELDNYFNDLKLKINQQLLNGYSMIDLANENNLQINKLINISKSNDDKSNLEQAIINTSFTLNKEFLSDVFDFDQNKAYIIYVDNIYPSEIESIDKAFENVIADFVKSKKLDYANKILDNNIDDNLTKIRDIFDGVIENQFIKLNSNNLPNQLINKIFNSEMGITTFSSDQNNIYFVKLENIEIENSANNIKEISLKSEFKNAFGSEIIKTKNISINDELINGLLSQYK